MPSADPLDTLAQALLRDEAVPFEWVIAHVRGKKIRAPWIACQDARTLLQVYAYTGDRPGLVRAACACARDALKYALPGDERARRTIETAESWARGTASLAQVEQVIATGRAPGSVNNAAIAAIHVITAVGVPLAGSAALAASFAADAAVRDIGIPRTLDDATEERRPELARLARIVRATIPCPTLDQLTAR